MLSKPDRPRPGPYLLASTHESAMVGLRSELKWIHSVMVSDRALVRELCDEVSAMRSSLSAAIDMSCRCDRRIEDLCNVTFGSPGSDADDQKK